MTSASADGQPRNRLTAVLDSAGFARAFTLAALGAVLGAYAIEHIGGHITYITIIVGLCVIGAGVLFARRRELSIVRIMPTTLFLFIVWAGVSLAWTTDRSSTVVGWATLAGLAFLGVVIAHIRDTLQTARALADVMRVMLSISLGVEIFSGILIDTPLPFLGVQGKIAALGPIQGIFGTRNMLGFVTVIALITFVIEWRTTSVRPGTSIYSVVLGGVLAVLSDSPTVLVLALGVGAATGGLILVRRIEAHRRRTLQWTLASVVVVGLVVAYVLRHQIIDWLGAASDFSTRASLWNTILTYVRFDPVLGWGWFGAWNTSEVPFTVINYVQNDNHASALNAYFDVLLQVGWVGLLLFIAFISFAFVRSWLVASERRSVVYAWTPLIMVALAIDSVFESFSIAGFGWVLLVICAISAGRSRSWRQRIDAIEPSPAAPDIAGPRSEAL